MNIRVRLIASYSILLVTVLVVFALLIATSMQWVLLTPIDHTLQETVNVVIENIRAEPYLFGPGGQPGILFRVPNLDILRGSGVYLQVWNAEGRLTYQSIDVDFAQPLDPEALGARSETLRSVDLEEMQFRVLTHPVILARTGDVLGYIQAGTSLRTIEEAKNQIFLTMGLILIIALTTSFLLGVIVLNRALRPIESIAATASQIATGDDLSRRIPYDGPADELGQLTTIFNATLNRLEKLFTAQKRFVADVSHELRTPLTVIQSNAELIRRHGADPESLELIDSESKRMSRLIQDLLLLAQADAGELPLSLKAIELDTVVLEVFKQAVVLDEGKGRVELGKFEPVHIYGDEDRLKQLLLNLISNAFKYTPPGGKITLSVWADGDEALVSVSDTGEGIPKEDLPFIFDRFYRVDKARARAHGGAGLGLSIAQWITEAHGGRISAKSAPGEGTTFTVHLPRIIPVNTSTEPSRARHTTHAPRTPAGASRRNRRAVVLTAFTAYRWLRPVPRRRSLR